MTYESNHVTVGPWGGQTGARWDDGLFSGVKQVVISYGAAIDSIQIEYDKNGCSVWSDKHGGTGGFRTNKVKFNYPDEFLVSISGYYGSNVDYGPVLVLSLSLESNKKKYGPFGIQQGTHFSFPTSGGMVVGFHGRSSWSLESIGVHLKPVLMRNPPDNLTASQNYTSNGVTEKTKGSLVREKKDNLFLPNRSFHRVEEDDDFWDNPKNYQSEIMYHKSGYSGSTVVKRTTVVKSTTRHTNRRTNGPFEDEQGVIFTSGNNGIIAGLPATTGRLADFFGAVIEGKPPLPRPFNDSFNMTDAGKGPLADFFGAHVIEEKPSLPRPSNDSFNMNDAGKGRFTDGFGAHVIEGKPPLSWPFNDSFNMTDAGKGRFADGFGAHAIEGKPPLSRPVKDSFNMTNRKTSQGCPGTVKEAARFSLGPWGGNGGKRWDDGVFSGVKKIFLFNGEAIYSMQVEYDRSGQPVLCSRHGGGSEGRSYTISLQYPHEVLTGFCGYYDSLTGEANANVVKSLTFFTNKGKYGPFGEETGTFFASAKSEGKIVGFHGSSGCYLNSIGVHVQA